MCDVCKLLGIDAEGDKQGDVQFVVQNGSVDLFNQTIDSAVSEGLTDIKVVTTEAGPSETFLGLEGRQDDLDALVIALFVTNFPARTVEKVKTTEDN